MAAETITLREYLNDLKVLLDNESTMEVVTHCRYILQHFPQNVDTYRLLGQALLQKGHHEGTRQYFDEAAEVFLRVLSAIPDDTVAHIGLSEACENNGDLNHSIWHLERAYEKLPSNTALLTALRRLYAKRDGEEYAPTKIQLTRVALARQYASSQLYDQSLLELHASLDQMPDRVDIKVLLAEILWESQRYVEAGEVAASLIKQLPNCITANRILAQLWLRYERPTDAQTFVARLEALVPYEAVRVVQPDLGRYRDPYELPRLDYSAKAAAQLSAETPDWVQDLGNLGPGSMDDVFAFGEPEPARRGGASRGPDKIDTDAVFGDSGTSSGLDWLDQIGTPSPEYQGPALSEGEAGESLGTDWMGDPSTFSSPEPGGEPLTAEVPDWFADFQKSEPSPAAEPGEQFGIQTDWALDEQEADLEDLLPSFDQLSTGVQPDESGSQESGFTGLLARVGEARTAESHFEEDLAAAMPEWLSFDEDESAPSMGDEEAAPDPLAWLDEAPSPGRAEEASKAEAAAVPGWMQELEEAEAGAAVTPDWMQELEEVEVEAAVTPDWMQELEETAGDAVESKLLDNEPEPEVVLPAAGDLDALRKASMPPSDLDLSEFFAEAGEVEAEDGQEGVLPARGIPTSEPEESDLRVAARSDAVSSGVEDWLSELEIIDDLGGGAEARLWPETEADYRALAEEDVTSEDSLDWLADSSVPAAPMTEIDGAAKAGGDWLPEGSGEIAPGQPSEVVPPALPEEVELEAQLSEDSGPGDWPSGVGELEDADLIAARGQVQADQPSRGADETETSPDLGEFPGWLRDAAPEADSPASTPGLAVDDLTAFFDAHDEEGAPIGAEFDVTESVPVEDDWLGAFARSEARDKPVDEQTRQVSDVAPSEPPAQEAVEAAVGDWLASMPEPELEPLAGDLADTLSFEAVEGELFGISEAADSVSEARVQPVSEDEESIAWALDAEFDAGAESVVEASPVGDLGDQDDTPAWLRGVEADTAPPASTGVQDILSQDYDPYDIDGLNVESAYESARQTGILQPNELPDWMRAFTGEDIPIDLEEDLERSVEDVEADSFAEQEFSVETEQPMLDRLDWTETGIEPASAEEEDESPAPDEDDTLQIQELELPLALEESLEVDSGESGTAPDWLLAIARSEADKLGDMFAEEEAAELEALKWDEEPVTDSAEALLAAADTGASAAMPEWLATVAPSEADQLGDLFAEEAKAEPDMKWVDESVADAVETLFGGAETEEGVEVPDWLAAAAPSGSVPLDDLFADEEAVQDTQKWDEEPVSDTIETLFAEAETAEESAETPDWLAAAAPVEAKPLDDLFADEEARLDTQRWDEETFAEAAETLFAGAETEESVEAPDWLAAAAPVEAEELDDRFVVEEDEPKPVPATGSSLDDSTAFDPFADPFADDDLLADLVVPVEQPEVAPPSELPHTRAVDDTFDEGDGFDLDDMSFDDLTPAWLRHPKEQHSVSPEQIEGQLPPETPGWLRDVFDEDGQDS